MSNQLRILIAASGSGGHLLPAIFIAQALKAESPDAQIEFVGSGRPLEAELIDRAGFKRHEVRIVGVNHRGLKGVLEFVRLLPGAILKTMQIFRALSPHIVIGVGGYVSVLPIIIARLKGKPSWIHEAELKPGLANFVLSLFASKVSVAFEKAELPRWAKTIFTGHPLRPELAQFQSKLAEVQKPTRLLVMGGSQGARAIDQAMIELAGFLKLNNFEILHQARAEDHKQIIQAYQKAEIKAEVVSFIRDMGQAYAWAELVISRSGAGAVMELGVVNIPCILVPYPYVKVNQLGNAKVLAEQGKALIVEQGDDFTQRLKLAIQELTQPQNYQQMHSKSFSGRRLDAAQQIALGAISLVKI